jgi:hypothetical protein
VSATKTLIHHSPLGELEIPGAGVVKPGERFSVDAAIADVLLEQGDVYQLASTPYDSVKLADLKNAAAERKLTVAGDKKADYIAALVADDVVPPPVVDEPAPIQQPEETHE